MQDILILGTGKMARNIGLFFLRKDCTVSWVSRDSNRVESFRGQLIKNIRRLALVLDKQPDDFNIQVLDISNIPKKNYDLILESIEEDLSQKQKIIGTVQHLLASDTVLASNSSSILPNQIHESAIGLHFFYPAELTGLIEIIINPNLKNDKFQGLIDQFRSWDVNPITQNENNAFAVNRLLLPMQAEAFRLLQAGYPAELINECSKSDRIKIGQFELMDSVGFDVILPAIKNYVSRMATEDQKRFKVLINGLADLILAGKLGKKNKNGLLVGEDSSWMENNKFNGMAGPLRANFTEIFNNTCAQFTESKKITKKDLNLVLHNLFS